METIWQYPNELFFFFFLLISKNIIKEKAKKEKKKKHFTLSQLGGNERASGLGGWSSYTWQQEAQGQQFLIGKEQV